MIHHQWRGLEKIMRESLGRDLEEEDEQKDAREELERQESRIE